MNIKNRLTLMSFLQFFICGAWLITVGKYWFGTKQWSGAEFGAVFATLALSSILLPAFLVVVGCNGLIFSITNIGKTITGNTFTNKVIKFFIVNTISY